MEIAGQLMSSAFSKKDRSDQNHRIGVCASEDYIYSQDSPCRCDGSQLSLPYRRQLDGQKFKIGLKPSPTPLCDDAKLPSF